MSRKAIIDGESGKVIWFSGSWKDAAKITDWYRISVDNSLQTNKSQQAFVCADDQWLYIAFRVSHPAPETIKPVAKKHDGRIQIENCVKILFDPGTDFNPWYIFRLSAGNIKAEQRNLRMNGEHQLQWDIPWRTATSMTKTGWIAEIAIPLASLYQTGQIDSGKTRFDLIVNSYEPLDGNPANLKKVIYSWSPVLFRYWADLKRFGYLNGLDVDDIRAPFLPQLKQVAVSGGYESGADGKMYYILDAQADTLSGRSGEAIVKVIDMPVGGKASVVSEKVDFSGGTSKKLRIRIPVTSAGKRDIEVELISAKNGEIWQKFEISNPEALNVLSVFAVLSYYTSETNAEVECTISLDKKNLAGACLKAVDADGKQLADAKDIAKNFTLEVPLNKLRIGKNQLAIKLESSSGAMLAATSVEITRLPPKPGCEVKINRKRLFLVKNGKPFIPFGIWGVSYSPEYLAAVRRAGMNTVFTYECLKKQFFLDAAKNDINLIMRPYRYLKNIECNVSDIVKGDMKNMLAEAVKGIPSLTYNPKTGMLDARPFSPLHFRLPVLGAKLGKKVASGLYNKFMTSPEAMGIYTKVVNASKNYPATLCYITFDEPIIPTLDEDVAGMAMYEKFQQLDPYHPVMVNFCGPPSEAPQASTFVDILCSDTYGSDVHERFRTANTLTNRCRKEKKVPWILLWAKLNRLGYHDAQVYVCVIAGVRGFYFFNFPIVSRQRGDRLVNLAGEIKRMQPFLIAPPLDYKVNYRPGKYFLDGGILPDVLAGVLKSNDGRYLLILSNCRDYPVDITMELPFAAKNCLLKSFRDNRTVKLSGKTLREKLEMLGVRAYIFEKASVERKLGPDSFKMELVMKPYPALAPPPPKPLNRFSGDKKNMMVNTSMEKATYPGWPDNYIPFHIGMTELEEKFNLDSNNPFHGKQSLRMTAKKGETFGFFINQGTDGGSKSDPYMGDPNIEYTLSVYLRGDGQGARLQMKSEKQKGRVMGLVTKGHVMDVVVPPKEWTRYSWKITMPAKLWFNVSGPGSIWIDAFQLEKSDKPTEYECQ